MNTNVPAPVLCTTFLPACPVRGSCSFHTAASASHHLLPGVRAEGAAAGRLPSFNNSLRGWRQRTLWVKPIWAFAATGGDHRRPASAAAHCEPSWPPLSLTVCFLFPCSLVAWELGAKPLRVNSAGATTPVPSLVLLLF